jgi:hypothetical protein
VNICLNLLHTYTCDGEKVYTKKEERRKSRHSNTTIVHTVRAAETPTAVYMVYISHGIEKIFGISNGRSS